MKRAGRRKLRMPIQARRNEPAAGNLLHSYRGAFQERGEPRGYSAATVTTRDRSIARP